MARVIILAGLILLTMAPVALAETPTPVPTGVAGEQPMPIDFGKLVAGLTPDLFIVLAVAMASGALGGLVYELLIFQGQVETPHRVGSDGSLLDLGFLGRMFVGALAAVAILYAINPADTVKLIALSVIAGSTGSAIFKSLQVRLDIALAEAKRAEAERTIEVMTSKVAEVRAQLETLRPGGRLSPAAGMTPIPAVPQVVFELLDEIKGIGDAAIKKSSPH
jgi:hypothetical protein